MKLIFTIILSICTLTATVNAQSYAKKSVSDIMKITSDSLAAGSINSPLLGDTVIVRGIVTIPPVVKFSDDNRKIMIAGNRNYAIYLADEKATEYAGMPVICDTSNAASNFIRLKVGQLIEVPIRITAFPSNNKLGTSQGEVISKGIVDFIDDGIALPTIPKVNIADFQTGKITGPSYNLATGSKYIGMKVEFTNLTVVSAVKSTSQRTTIIVSDDQGNEMYLRDQSNYFRTDAVQLASFVAPTDGAKILSLKGYISTNSAGGQPIPFMISPGIPEDLTLDMSAAPPVLTSCRSTRVKAFPASSETVPIAIGLRQGAKPMSAVNVVYTFNGGTAQNAMATKVNDTLWTATIPATSSESLVRWKVIATDSANITVKSPIGDTAYIYYRVLDRTPKISDIREQFIPNGASQYESYAVKISGTVIASASDIPNELANAPRVYIQDDIKPYSGIYVRTTSPTSVVRAFPRGSKVEVTGIIRENFGVTSLDSVKNQDASLVSTNGENYSPVVVTTDMFARKRQGETSAEQWESMLVTFKNVKVADTNADGASDFGELNVVNASAFGTPNESMTKMRVETNDGSTSYAVSPKMNKVVLQKGASLESLTGIMFFSFGNYKLVPRDNNDIVLGATSVLNDSHEQYDVSVYPNPANQSGTLSITVPQSMNASIQVFSSLGTLASTIHNGFISEGNHNFLLHNLPSGLYTVRLHSELISKTVSFIIAQ